MPSVAEMPAAPYRGPAPAGAQPIVDAQAPIRATACRAYERRVARVVVGFVASAAAVLLACGAIAGADVSTFAFELSLLSCVLYVGARGVARIHFQDILAARPPQTGDALADLVLVETYGPMQRARTAGDRFEYASIFLPLLAAFAVFPALTLGALSILDSISHPYRPLLDRAVEASFAVASLAPCPWAIAHAAFAILAAVAAARMRSTESGVILLHGPREWGKAVVLTSIGLLVPGVLGCSILLLAGIVAMLWVPFVFRGLQARVVSERAAFLRLRG